MGLGQLRTVEELFDIPELFPFSDPANASVCKPARRGSSDSAPATKAAAKDAETLSTPSANRSARRLLSRPKNPPIERSGPMRDAGSTRREASGQSHVSISKFSAMAAETPRSPTTAPGSWK